MEDVIRKAVELADGWEWREDCVHVLDTPMHYWADAIPQTILDALAAQLTRQVDASGEKNWVLTTRNTSQVHIDGWVQPYQPGPDRTMNTIKAIVDSKVLERDD